MILNIKVVIDSDFLDKDDLVEQIKRDIKSNIWAYSKHDMNFIDKNTVITINTDAEEPIVIPSKRQ